jgi:hypothetical protein
VSSDFVHRELLLPPPTENPPRLTPFVWPSEGLFSLEIHREREGKVRYLVGTNHPSSHESLAAYLENERSRIAIGDVFVCPPATYLPHTIFARASPLQRHHHSPVGRPFESDPAGLLLRTFATRTLREHDLVLQLLFQRVPNWELTFLSPRYERVAEGCSRAQRAAMDARQSEAVYHAEIRARINGPQPAAALHAIGPWLEQWTLAGGTPWRSWQVVSTKLKGEFLEAMLAHDIDRFSSPKASRDISATELARLLPIPWASRHPECSYGGAPRGRPDPELILPLPVSRVPASEPTGQPPDPRLLLGAAGSRPVGLPVKWNHAVLLGRTQSGKSTLALALALQILRKQPGSTVVVIEPTGKLVEGIGSRLPKEIASESIEVVPADGPDCSELRLRQPSAAGGSGVQCPEVPVLGEWRSEEPEHVPQ